MKKPNDSTNLVITLTNYGYIFFLQKDFKKELSVYQRAVSIANKLDDKQLLIGPLNNVGNAYLLLNELDSAEMIFRNILDLNPGSEYFAYLSIAGIKKNRNQFDSALYYFRRSNNILLEKARANEYLVHNYFRMADLFRDINQFDSAFFYATKSYQTAAETPDSLNLADPANLLAQLYKDKHDYKNALKYLSISKKIEDKAYDINRQKELFNISFEEQLKEIEIEAAKKELRNQVKQYSLLTAIGILLGGAALLYRNNKNKQKTNRILGKALDDLKSTQSQLIQSEKEKIQAFHLKKILELEAQALRAQMNPHFIFNSLNSIKSLINKNENGKAADYLITFSKLIRTLFQIPIRGK